MYKKEHSKKILNLIKKGSLSQSEIKKLLDNEISIQGVAKDLKRYVDIREIAYFGNGVPKLHTRILLKKRYDKKWTPNAHQIYIHTPKSGKLYKKLLRKCKKKNLDLIKEITDLYRVIEVYAKFQEMYVLKDTKLGKDIIKFHKERSKRINFHCEKELERFFKIIKMNPEMHWLAYREEKIKNELTFPMFTKMGELFIRNKNILIV